MEGIEISEGWFHCGRCGCLFKVGPVEVCPECHGNPIVEDSELAFAQLSKGSAEPVATMAAISKQAAMPVPKASRGRGVVVFVIVWLVLLGGLVGLVYWLRSDDPVQAGSDSDGITEQTERGQFINEAYSVCQPALVAFLHDGAPELRAKHVMNSAATIGRMSRAMTKAPVLAEDENPRMELFDTFEGPSGRAIQSIWNLEDGRRVEALFFREKDEWKIDWNQMTRYSDEPWSLFMSGNGPASGEFRLLARKRTGLGGGQGDVSRLMLLSPKPWDPQRTGLRSPEILVNPESAMGLRLTEAFAMRERGEGVFGTSLTDKDPKGMIRVRVRLRRSAEKTEEGKWSFIIEDLAACHWMGVAEER